MTSFTESCPVCGGNEFVQTDVLWEELIRAWELTPSEVACINRQQGYHCKNCFNNLRGMALAKAILVAYGANSCLRDFVTRPRAQELRVLEVNEAAQLTSTLKELPNHRLICFPQHDMTALNIESDSYDLIIHSDTLEHVADPIVGLAECKRVLRERGHCIFTVPMIVTRLTRSRTGLPASYHGAAGKNANDQLVHTEFGADAWTFGMQAGFSRASIYALEYPAGLALSLTK